MSKEFFSNLQSLRPKIAVTGPDQGGGPAWLCTSLILKALGAQPHRVQPQNYDPNLSFDGLVLGGGSDLSPDLYQESALPVGQRSWWARLKDYLYLQNIWQKINKKKEMDRPRDRMELEMFRRALEKGVPVLGICRGHQLINVALGGQLETELSHYYEKQAQPRSLLPVKTVEIEPHSLLARVTGSFSLRINALHNQAVGRLADSCKGIAVESSGVLQALEGKGLSSPVLGVQWHPEYLFYHPEHRKLFRWLIVQAQRKLSQKTLEKTRKQKYA